MEYAKDEIFTINYSKEDYKKINNRWILRILIIIASILITANAICIYNFFYILGNLS